MSNVLTHGSESTVVEVVSSVSVNYISITPFSMWVVLYVTSESSVNKNFDILDGQNASSRFENIKPVLYSRRFHGGRFVVQR